MLFWVCKNCREKHLACHQYMYHLIRFTKATLKNNTSMEPVLVTMAHACIVMAMYNLMLSANIGERKHDHVLFDDVWNKTLKMKLTPWDRSRPNKRCKVVSYWVLKSLRLFIETRIVPIACATVLSLGRTPGKHIAWEDNNMCLKECKSKYLTCKNETSESNTSNYHPVYETTNVRLS